MVPERVGFWSPVTDPAAAKAAADFAVQFNGLLDSVYGAAGSPVAPVQTAFAVTDFTDFVDLTGVGPVPLSVHNACTWTRICTPPPLGPDIHADTDGYGVIAQAFEAALP